MDCNPNISRLWFGKWWSIVYNSRMKQSTDRGRSRDQNKRGNFQSHSNRQGSSRTRIASSSRAKNNDYGQARRHNQESLRVNYRTNSRNETRPHHNSKVRTQNPRCETSKSPPRSFRSSENGDDSVKQGGNEKYIDELL